MPLFVGPVLISVVSHDARRNLFPDVQVDELCIFYFILNKRLRRYPFIIEFPFFPIRRLVGVDLQVLVRKPLVLIEGQFIHEFPVVELLKIIFLRDENSNLFSLALNGLTSLVLNRSAL
jgi:hypothetical protein